MLAIVPIAVDAETPTPRRATPLTWLLVATWVAAFVAPWLAALAIDRHWTWMPSALARALLGLAADAELNPRRDQLFAWWQPWTYALLHAGWWHLATDLAIATPCARALEQRRGAAQLALLVAQLAALAAVPSLLTDRALGAIAGGSAIAAGLVAWTCARMPGARMRLVVGWWLVVVVGALRVRVPLAIVAVVWLVADGVRTSLAGDRWAWTAALAGVAAGSALAAMSRDDDAADARM